MSQTQSAMRAALLTGVLTLLAAGCALDGVDDAPPAPLAQQAAIDGGVRITPTTDGGIVDDAGDAPVDPGPDDDDAGMDDDPAPAGETVKLADGGIIYLDETCPDREAFGITQKGCCRAGKCGLSNHLLDQPGVSLECQSYADIKEFDDAFDLPDKTCRARR
ncbi:MAG: hypothetical protein ABW252_02610 [Polyangiales bacterium]